MKLSFIVLIIAGFLVFLYFLGAFPFLEPEKKYSAYDAEHCINGRYDAGESVTIIERQGDDCKLEMRSRSGKPVTTTGAIGVICILPIEKIPLLRSTNSTPTAEYFQYCQETKS